MKTHKMELLKAGKDLRGDIYTIEALQGMMDDFKPGLLVGLEFNKFGSPQSLVGTIESLVLKDGVLSAEVKVDDTGSAAIAKGAQLASGSMAVYHKDDQDHYIFKSAKLTGAILTESKVK